EFEYINSNMYFTDNMYDASLIDNIEEDPVSNKILEEIFSEFDGFDGEYGLYFPNFMSAALYVWNTEFIISTSAYKGLVKIITHPKFRKDDVIKNIRCMHKWRCKLPLLTVHQHDVPICFQKAPSVFTSTKKAFTISSLKHLKHILNNPAIMSKLYFSPGIIKNEKSEFWHGSFWQESPLFGSHEIKSDSGGDSVFVDPKNISQHVNVWFLDLPEPDNYNFYVQEVIYRFDDYWKYRDISTRYRIPCESVMLKTPPQPMSIYK
ncbi:15007_t:CDS:2, partial [Cetraspora pellucida]